MVLYEPLGAADDPDAPGLGELCASWADALMPLEEGDLAQAHRRFGALAARWPDDGPAAYWHQKLAALLAGPAEPSWDDIDRFDQKWGASRRSAAARSTGDRNAAKAELGLSTTAARGAAC